MKHLELFSGIGGFRNAMEFLQHDHIMDFINIGYSEIEQKAIQTYCANYNTEGEIVMGDIVEFTRNKANIENLPNFDILTGGFPCQSFSMMGKQLGFNDERGQMFFRIMDILAIKRPQYVLLENVKNLFTHNSGKTFNRIIRELQQIGYHVYYDIFNSNLFGLPQTRNRVIIFATTEDIQENFDFSALNVKTCFDANKTNMSIAQHETVLGILAKHVPQKYYLSEKIKPTILADGSAGFKSKSEINQLTARPLTASMHKMHRACQDNYYSQDFIDSAGRINAVEIMNKEQLAKLSIRKLTPSEAMQLQGFPNNFAENGSRAGVNDGSLYKQAGNAVSVNTIYAILYYLITNNIIH